jgi:carboxyl-terminal processing protease
MESRYPGPARPPSFLITAAAFVLGALVMALAQRTTWLFGAHEPPGVARTFAPFWEAWDLVEKNYVDRQAVQPEHMTQGAIQGMLDSLGDRDHTTYLTRTEFEQMQASLKSSMEGIGARMTMQAHQPTVVAVVPGSPAEQNGLRPGDVFLEVDGKPVADMPLDKIVNQVRGKAGTGVHLQVMREGKKLDFDIIRGRVDMPNASWHLLPGEPKIGHLYIEEFGGNAKKQVQAALREAKEAGARGLIVDVRGDPGGLKEQAVDVTSLFLHDGVVFIEKDAQGRQKPIPVKHQEGDEVTDLPLVVLIDHGTASSAEIFAGALQDHRRGKLVGTVTFGTGTVLYPYLLTDGSAVVLAIAEWLTPDGRQIWHKGIEPDVQAALPPNARVLLPDTEGHLTEKALAKSDDKQLLKALEVLKQQLH